METSLPANPKSELLLPPPRLSNCIFGAFVRDTRGCDLPAHERFNHFGASPFCAISWRFEGDIHLLEVDGHVDDLPTSSIHPEIVFSGPQQIPRSSWNAGDAYSMIVTFYPEAFSALTGLNIADYLNQNLPAQDVLPHWMMELCREVQAKGSAADGFRLIATALSPVWQDARPWSAPFGPVVSDWARSLAHGAAFSAAGKSTRQIQRRIKAWTGQSQRQLNSYGQLDKAYQQALHDQREGVLNLAELSHEVGFSDQAHMSRQVRNQTGFSPADLMRRIDQDESMWAFRLLGKYY